MLHANRSFNQDCFNSEKYLTDKESRIYNRVFSIRFIAVAGLIILSVGFFCIGLSRLIYPFDFGVYESFIWLPSGLLMSGENPYAFATREPFVMSPYGIVYYLLTGIGVKFFGLQLWWGRLLSIVATLVCLISIGRIARDLTGKKHIARIAQLVFLCAYPLQMWFGVQRSDLIGLAFAFAGLSLILTEKKDSKGNKLILLFATLCFALAFFSKQTVVLPVFIAALSYWFRGKRMSVIYLLSITIALSLVIGFVLNQTSNGGYVWQHFTHAQGLPFSYYQAFALLKTFIKVPSTLVFIAAILFAAWHNRKTLFSFITNLSTQNTFLNLKKGLIIFYLVAAFSLAVVTTGRLGASTLYYLETALIGAIIFALACDWLERNGKEKYAIMFTVLLILSSGLFLISVARGEYYRWQSVPYYLEMTESVRTLTPPNSICISVYPEIVTKAGRSFHFDDWGEYNDGWSPELKEVFNKAISSKRYAAIIMHSDGLKFDGYHLVRMKTPPPEKFYKAFLYVRDANPSENEHDNERK